MIITLDIYEGNKWTLKYKKIISKCIKVEKMLKIVQKKFKKKRRTSFIPSM